MNYWASRLHCVLRDCGNWEASSSAEARASSERHGGSSGSQAKSLPCLSSSRIMTVPAQGAGVTLNWQPEGLSPGKHSQEPELLDIIFSVCRVGVKLHELLISHLAPPH